MENWRQIQFFSLLVTMTISTSTGFQSHKHAEGHPSAKQNVGEKGVFHFFSVEHFLLRLRGLSFRSVVEPSKICLYDLKLKSLYGIIYASY